MRWSGRGRGRGAKRARGQGRGARAKRAKLAEEGQESEHDDEGASQHDASDAEPVASGEEQ